MKLNQNVGTADRIIRVVVAAALGVAVSAGTVAAPVSWIVSVIGAILLVTGLTAFCPLYALFGIATGGRRPVAHG